MIWIDYEQLIMDDCFDCIYIYIHEQFSLFDTNTNVLTGFMISLLQHLLQEYEEHET